MNSNHRSKPRPDELVGVRIKRERLALGISQRELATEHVTYAYISRIEAGTRNPSWAALIEIAAKLRTTALRLGLGDAKSCPVCGSAIHG